MTSPAVANRRYRIFVSATSDGLTDYRPSGDGLVAYALLRELAARGHDIDVAGTGIALRGSLPSNVRFHSLPLETSETLRDRVRYALLVRQLYNSLSRVAPYDVVHQLNPVVAGLSLGFGAFAPPLVLGSYIQNWAEPFDGRRGSRARMILRSSIRNVIASLQQLFAASIIVTTETARDRVPLAPFLRRKISIIPHGIDISAIPEPERVGSAEDGALTILFLANLVRRKGIFTLLDAFERVAARVPDARLLIGGSGEEEAVRALVTASPHRDRIELLGNVGRDEIVPTLRRASVYCLPSHGEPFGMTALEAMACGLPVVVTRECGLGEIVPDSAGRKVPSGDAEALADALESLLVASDAERARIGGRNRAYVQERFALPAIVDRLEAVYARVVRAPRISQRAMLPRAGMLSR